MLKSGHSRDRYSLDLRPPSGLAGWRMTTFSMLIIHAFRQSGEIPGVLAAVQMVLAMPHGSGMELLATRWLG